ncbi:SAM-dependent methyltransferase [Streptomyces sp. NPDC093801]|uniref:SAM-dependent methyltransferase n=1 Tax=Streptomyces sp. NPDC093801 TaxID=3155203 RepID=UPI00344DF16B
MSHRITRGDLLRTLQSPKAVSACLALPSRAESVRTARRFVAHQLEAWGCAAAEPSTALVSSELATNAIKHRSPGAEAQDFLVSVTFEPGVALVVQVADANPGLPVVKARQSALATGGRGLFLVTQVADYWSASPRSDGQGKVVSAYFRAAQVSTDPPGAYGLRLPEAAAPPTSSSAGPEAHRPDQQETGGGMLPSHEFSRPSVPRVHNWLGGDVWNFDADRILGKELLEAAPWLRQAVAAARDHGQKSVSVLAHSGIVQFLDLGCGLPQRHGQNTHDAAKAAAGESTVVYVDRDPSVCAHYRSMLETSQERECQADFTQPEALLAHPALAHLDRSRPIAVLLHEVLPWLDDEQTRHLLASLQAWLPTGSVLSVIHTATDSDPQAAAGLVAVYRNAGITYRPRSLEQLLALFQSWDVDVPGITAVPLDRLRVVGSRKPVGRLRGVGGRKPLYGSYAVIARVPNLLLDRSCPGAGPEPAGASVPSLAEADRR